MVAHFYPETVYTVVTLPQLNNLMLPFQHNLILNLPINTICEWLAYNRLGKFILKDDDVFFVPGINRRDIYCPIVENYPVFELANLFHEHGICHHQRFINLSMSYRHQFQHFITQNAPTENCETFIFHSIKRSKPIARVFKIRTKRKIGQAKCSWNIDKGLLKYLTQKV